MSENTKVVARFFEEFCNSGKLNLAAELFTSDHQYHDPSSPWVKNGPAGQQDLIGAYRNGFPDASWTVNETLEAGDRVITRWSGAGTNRGSLAGISPTGQSVKVSGVWIHRISGGKIAESWNHWDYAGMLQQLGLAPVMTAA